MIKVNTKIGKTLSFNLDNEDEKALWIERSSDTEFQHSITGIGIIYNSQWYTLPLPKKFKKAIFHAEVVRNRKKLEELVGEKIMCHVDDVQVSLLVYYGNRPKMCRIDVTKVGKMRYNPSIKGGQSGKEV